MWVRKVKYFFYKFEDAEKYVLHDLNGSKEMIKHIFSSQRAISFSKLLNH